MMARWAARTIEPGRDTLQEWRWPVERLERI
jgi:hypothetical protein